MGSKSNFDRKKKYISIGKGLTPAQGKQRFVSGCVLPQGKYPQSEGGSKCGGGDRAVCTSFDYKETLRFLLAVAVKRQKNSL